METNTLRSLLFVILADCPCSVSNACTHLHVQHKCPQHNPTCRNTFHRMCARTHAHIHVHAQCKHAHPQHNPTCRNTFHCMCARTHAHIHVHAQCKHAHPQHNPTCRNTFQIKRQNFTLACLQKTLQPTWNWFQFHKHNIVELWMSFHWTAKNAIPSSTQFAEYNPLKMGRSCK